MATEAEWDCPFAVDPPNPKDGPGTRLYRILHRMGFRETQTCGCKALTLAMNDWGATICRQNADIITESLGESAKDQKANPLRIPFFAPWVKKLVLHCCK